ncbi:MAG: hypothetical protein KDD47_10215, partial [Acidobacteria bacterium]|nr:hypothetical protein [Acidobacteriota bacterium]
MYSKTFCVLTVLVLALLAVPAAHAGCDFQPKFCNRNDETTKNVVVTCTPAKGFISGGYVLVG